MKFIGITIIIFALINPVLSQVPDDPTDTQLVRTLTELVQLRKQAQYGMWLKDQTKEAQYGMWLKDQTKEAQYGMWLKDQTKEARKTIFFDILNQPDLLLRIKNNADRPNYPGNAYAKLHGMLWLRIINGDALIPD